MKLQAVRDGRVYATSGRTVYVDETGTATGFERRGDLPAPRSRDGARLGPVLEGVVRTQPWKAALGSLVGRYAATNLWPVGDDALVATVGRWVSVSRDGGASWTVTHDLPPSSGPAGVLPTGLCVQRGTLYLGEYPLDDAVTPRVLASHDEGRTWEPVLELPGVRHVHGVHADPYTDDVWVTTGDTDDECRIGRLTDPLATDDRLDAGFEVVGGGSQSWRAVSLVFTPDAILWGVDCPYLDRKPIYRLDRDAVDDRVARTDRAALDARPTRASQPARAARVARADHADVGPERVHAVPNSVYYGTRVTVDGTDWAVFATAAEVGQDSTAPDREHAGTDVATVVASPATTDFRSWHVLGEFRRRRRLSDRFGLRGRLPRANAYVFVAAAPDGGVLVNPYNATPHDGDIIALPADTFRRLQAAEPVGRPS